MQLGLWSQSSVSDWWDFKLEKHVIFMQQPEGKHNKTVCCAVTWALRLLWAFDWALQACGAEWDVEGKQDSFNPDGNRSVWTGFTLIFLLFSFHRVCLFVTLETFINCLHHRNLIMCWSSCLLLCGPPFFSRAHIHRVRVAVNGSALNYSQVMELQLLYVY